MEAQGLSKTDLYAVFVFTTNEDSVATLVDRDYIVYRFPHVAYNSIREVLVSLNIPKALSAYPHCAMRFHIYCTMQDKSCKLLEFSFTRDDDEYLNDLDNILLGMGPVDRFEKIILYGNERVRETKVGINEEFKNKLTV